MKKGKNITLLVGIACVSAVVIWQVIKTIFYYFSILNEDGFSIGNEVEFLKFLRNKGIKIKY